MASGEVKLARVTFTAAPAVTAASYMQSVVYASLLPRLDMLKSLGLVWISRRDGGHDRIGSWSDVCRYLSVHPVAMILTASGISALVTTLLLRTPFLTRSATNAGAVTPNPNNPTSLITPL
jgi:putative ABC transport system permease protein